jgi:hypothetical protein
MKKLFMITAFAIAISIPASFGHARIEVTNAPLYDQNRDQQWMQSQQQQRQEDQRRMDWQRAQWQQEQSQRHERHQQEQSYDFWLSLHSRDYDNSRR